MVSNRQRNDRDSDQAVAQFQAYVRFVSVDPARNRYRYYGLTWQPSLWGDASAGGADGPFKMGRNARGCGRAPGWRDGSRREVGAGVLGKLLASSRLT
jgi:hypothetical protein